MRLTLRTLLAYLDDILDPADARELGKKIEESEFAGGLVHRIRSVSRKLRLGAPKLAGKGMGLDANTVAEYLDNTLPQDRAPDFEKVCLESDVHLAEVASCHQILTLVLGEPADVDPALRERVRALLAKVEEPATDFEDERVAPETREMPVAPPIDPRSRDVEDATDLPLVAPALDVGDTGPSFRLLPIVGTLVVTFLLALVALIAIGPLDENHPIIGGFLSDSSVGSQPVAEGKAEPDPSTAQTRLAQGPDNASPKGRDPNARVVQPDAAPAVTNDSNSGSGLPPATPLPDSGHPDSSAFPLPPARDVPDTRQAAVPKMDVETEAPTSSIPDPLPPLEGGTGEANTVAPNDDAMPKATGAPPGASEAAEPLARYVSDLHILARHDIDSDTWLRLETGNPLRAGDRLVALPTYRPQITFSTKVNAVLVGPTAASTMPPVADGTPGLAIDYGRLLIRSGGAPGTSLILQVGDRMSRVEFQSLDSTLAVYVSRYLAPGSNPETEIGQWVTQVIGTVGRARWIDSHLPDEVMIEAGQISRMIDLDRPELGSADETPAWLDAGNMRPIDRDASKQLEPLLLPNRPLSVSLQERASSRLVEVRSLAIGSLSLFDTYDPFVAAFNTSDLRAFWPDLFEQLRTSILRDPETAAKVRTTFERLRQEDGNQLFRLFWGYSPAQLEDGQAEYLVQCLSSPSMDIRVLAFENLIRIVGKTNSYYPHLDPKRQKRAILNWGRDFQNGEIIHATPPKELGE